MENQILNKEKTAEKHDLVKKLDTVGWGLFFIWIGVAFIAGFKLSVGLLGIGIITLGMQGIRKYFNQNLEGFWIVVGLLFLIGGIWELFEIKFELAPILIIIAGAVIILSALRRK